MTRFTWAFAKPGQETEWLSRMVADRIWPERARDFGNCQCIAVMDGDQLAAGLVYHNFDPEAGVVEISGASWIKGWLTRDVLRIMYAYPFIDCGCQAVVQRVSDADTAQHRMLKAYGAERYRIPRLRGREEAENVFVTTLEAWEGNRFNRKVVGNG